jgi:hypothetical protein
MGLHGLLQGQLCFYIYIYIYDVRTSQETHLRISTACYRDSLTFLPFTYSISFELARRWDVCANISGILEACRSTAVVIHGYQHIEVT